jgi:hypothetical protein
MNSTTCTAAGIAHLGGVGLNTSANLTVRPLRLAFPASGGEARFTVKADRVGCFALNYTVVGGNGTITPPATQVVWVLPLGTTPAPPPLLSARFAANGATVTLTFGGVTDRGGSTGGNGRCSAFVGFSGAASAFCVWSTPRVLLADLGTSASLLPGDTVTLLAGRISSGAASDV